jgi:hypothetical protein
MATIVGPLDYTATYLRANSTVNLQSSQTGNADSTNTADRGILTSGAHLKVVSTVGATPTVTLNILGSINGTDFFNIPYALVATPTTFVVSAITITTATTNHYLLQSGQPWRYLKLNMSANTNVTLTSDVYFPPV